MEWFVHMGIICWLLIKCLNVPLNMSGKNAKFPGNFPPTWDFYDNQMLIYFCTYSVPT